MNTPTPLLLAIGAAMLSPAFQARAEAGREEAPSPPGQGIAELSDEELGAMRGRYTVGGNTVAWFGVSMVSTWQTQAGQILESTMTVGMDFRQGNTPKVSFTPTVSITEADAPMPQASAQAVQTAVAATPMAAPAQDAVAQAPVVQEAATSATTANATAVPPPATAEPASASAPAPAAAQLATAPEPQRSTDASGLQNASGLVQSVQVAGDRNLATNTAHLELRDGAVPDLAQGATGGTATTSSGAATATSSFSNGTAGVLLLIAGQGEVQQWIRNGSVGQSIQLTADAQRVSNRLQLDLVRQSLSDNAPLTQNVAQAISLARGMGPVGR